MSGERVKGITVVLGGDTTGLKKAVNELDKPLNETQRSLKDIERLLKLDPTNTLLLEQKQRLLSKAVDDTKTKLDVLKEAERQAQEQFQRGEISQEQYEGLQREIVATEQKLKDLEKQAKNCGNSMSAAFADAGKKLQEVGGKITDAGKNMLPVTGAVAALATGSAKAAIDFESAFAGVIKTVDATDAELDELRTGIREMAKEMPTSANEIAGVAEAAGQLGIETKSILGFTETMVMLGDATNLSANDAATALARLANITQMPQSEFGRLGSSVVALGNNLATTESEIVDMGLNLAAAGKQVGLTEAEILGFAGALSSVGIEAQAGGTAFSKVMVEMQLAAETGGQSLEDFASVAGMSAEDFKAAFEEDAAGAMISFIQGLQDAENRGVSAIKMLDDMGITEVRLRDALLRAAGAGDVFTDAIQLSSAAWEENTALANEAAQRYATTESQMEMLKNKVIDLGIQLGEYLLPFILSLIEYLGGVVDWFAQLDPSIQQTVMVILGLVAAIGPLLIVIGKMATGLGALMNLMAFLSGTIIPGVGAALSFLAANPIVLIIAAVVALIAIIAKFGDDIQAVLQKVDDFLQGVFAKDWTTVFGPVLGGVLNAFFANVKNIWDSIKRIFDGIIDFIRGIFTGNWERAWNGVKNIFGGIFDGLIGMAKAPINGIISLLNMAIGGINSLIGGLNRIKFDVPSWVPGLGGKSFGINIPDIPRIPALAKGAVLPPGKPFLAQLSDQKFGTNLETPESLLRSIFRDENSKAAPAPAVAGGAPLVNIEEFNNYDTDTDMPKLTTRVSQEMQKIIDRDSRSGK